MAAKCAFAMACNKTYQSYKATGHKQYQVRLDTICEPYWIPRCLRANPLGTTSIQNQITAATGLERLPGEPQHRGNMATPALYSLSSGVSRPRMRYRHNRELCPTVGDRVSSPDTPDCRR